MNVYFGSLKLSLTPRFSAGFWRPFHVPPSPNAAPRAALGDGSLVFSVLFPRAQARGLEFGHFLKGGADNLVCPFGFHKEAKSVAAEM